MSTAIKAILIISEISLILTHLGIFCILPVILIVGLFILSRLKSGTQSGCTRVLGFSLGKLPVGLILLMLVSFFFFRPYQYMDGGWDPGNYINTGVHIARTGSVVYHDPYLKETTYGAGIKYPGLYIKDAEKGIVVPQFFHLYPVWIAIFYKIFGLWSVFYVNPFFALLSVILLFQISKRMVGKGYGFLSAALLGLNVIQIWNARFPTSEILAQFFLLSGFWFWQKYLEQDDRVSAFWAGVSFGEFLMVSVTSLLIIPVLAVYLFFRFRKKDIFFIAPFLFFVCHLGIQSLSYSSTYMETVLMFFQKRELYFILIVFIWIASLLMLLKITVKNYGWTRGSVAVITLLFFIYGYFIRSRISGSVEARNLIELGNWLSFFALFIAFLGLILILIKNRNEALSLFIVSALIYLIFFIYDKRMNSRYPFALRRYIPIVIPAYCICISYFYANLKRFAGFLSVLIIPILIIVPLYRCRHIIMAKDHYGLVRFWTDFAAHMDDNALYIANNYRWARPLSDIFGKKAVIFTNGGKNLCEFAKEHLENGEDVYYISDSEKPYEMDLDFKETCDKKYIGEYIEDSMTFPPGIKKTEIDFKIYKITEIQEPVEDSYTVEIGENDIGLLRGFDRPRIFSNMATPARWTFRKGEMVIPWLGDDVNQVLTIMVGGMSEKAGETIIYIYINGIPIAENIKIAERMQEYNFNIPKGTIYTGGDKRVILSIKSTTWSPKGYGIDGFPDDLGLLLDWIKISR